MVNDQINRWVFTLIAKKSIKWYAPIIDGTIGGSILTYLCAFGASQILSPNGISAIAILTVASISFTVCYVATLTLRPKRFQKNAIGFLLAIRAEASDIESRITSDILPTIRDCLARNNTTAFEVQALHSMHSTAIEDDKSASNYLKYCRGRFLLHGSLTRRRHRGEECLLLKIRALVTHRVTTRENSHLLSQEMAAVIPTKSKISIQNELSGLEFTGEMIAYGAQYVVATSLFISGNVDEAITTLESLLKTIKNSSNRIPTGNPNLFPLAQKRLIEFNLHKIKHEYTKWRNDHDTERIRKIEDQISKLPEIWKKNSAVLNQRAICHLVLRRNIGAAKELVRKAREIDPLNSSLYYSQAFLEAYLGKIIEAKRSYARGFKQDGDGSISLEVEEFLAWIIEEESNNYQLIFFLGYINFHKKKDLVSAKNDLKKFLELPEYPDSKSLRQEASLLLKEINDILARVEN